MYGTDNIKCFNEFLSHIEVQKITLFKGRKFRHQINNKEYSLNTIIKKLNSLHQQIGPQNRVDLEKAIKRIEELDSISDMSLRKNNFLTKIATKIKSVFSKLFFNRERILSFYKQKLASMNSASNQENTSGSKATLFISKEWNIRIEKNGQNSKTNLNFKNLSKLAGKQFINESDLNQFFGNKFLKKIQNKSKIQKILEKYIKGSSWLLQLCTNSSPQKIKRQFLLSLLALKEDLLANGFDEVASIYLNEFDETSKENEFFSNWAFPHSRFPVPNNIHQQNRNQAIGKAIALIASVANTEKVPYWLDGETLLGIQQSSGILPYSKEGMISFLEEDTEKVINLLNKIASDHSKTYSIYSIDSSKAAYLKDNSSGAIIKIHFYRKLENSEKLQWIDPMEDTAPVKSWRFPLNKEEVFPLLSASINGVKVNIPANSENFLLYRYGDIRPTHKLSSDKTEYIPISGDENVSQQGNLIQQIKDTKSDENVTMTGKYTQMEATPTPKSKIERHDKWKEVLFEMKKLLDDLEIHWWLDAGTLIGAYRYNPGQIIPWDHDADISMLQADFNRIVEVFSLSKKKLKEKYNLNKGEYNILNSSEYKLEDWSKDDCINGKSISRKNYLRLKINSFDDYLDIYQWVYDDQSKKMHWIDPYPFEHDYPWYRRFTEHTTVLPLKKVNYYHGQMRVPNNTQAFLEERYGDLRPCMIYDSKGDSYYKDDDHHYNKMD